MRTRLLIVAALLLILFLTACTINRPVAATTNPLGSKTGVYTQMGILGFPPFMNNNAAIAQAARNGGITNISTVDYNMTWMIFIMKYETIVTGE